MSVAQANAHSGDRDIVETNPQKASFDEALTLLQSGDAKSAEQVCCDALESFPEDANILCLSARALIRLEQLDKARDRLNNTLALFPEFARPYEILGELLMAQDKPDQAVDQFRRAVHLGADSPDVEQKLVSVLTMLGRTDEAQDILKDSRERHPVRAAIADAREFERNGDRDMAERIFRKVLMREPNNIEALAGIGAIALAKGQYTDAEIFLQKAVEQAPDFARAWADLVVAQMELEKYDESIESAEHLVRLDVDGVMSRLLLGNARAMAGRHDDALSEYEQIVARIPGDPGALSGMAHMLKTIGRQDESVTAYKACIRENPHHTEAWWGLANMKTYEFSDDEVDTMLHLLESGEAKAEPTSRWLSSTPEVNLCSSLGVAFEGRGDYESAFEYFDRGNKKRRLDEPYDPVYTEHLHDHIIETFSREFLEDRAGNGSGKTDAIFIVGLPRTGSTLIEQILASHGDVDGTHELPELPRIVQSLPVVDFQRSRYPLNVLHLEPDAYLALGEDYIERTRKYRTGKPFFTDKNLSNFMHVGLLELILPNTKIIDARRHPLDTCLGCYKQLFARGQSFSYDLDELGEYYLQYRRLMDHWDDIMPGKVLAVHYEEVTADLESQVRRILEHCDLAWDERCLRFFETKRDVRTASSEQVRQPIYRSSVKLWRHYETQLSELIEVLEPVLQALPGNDRPASLRNKNIT